MLRRTHETLPRTAASLLLILAVLSLAGPAAAGAEGPAAPAAGAVVIGPPTPGLHQEAYVKAPNPGSSTPSLPDGDWFGSSGAFANGTLVVGAPHENGGDGGVNGDLGDDSLNNAGAAYVYRRISTGWQYEAYLKAASPDLGDLFGHSVATDGNVVVVGAPESGALSQGHAFVFERTTDGWVPTATLEASNAGFMDGFGTSVAVSSGLITVGAPGEDGVDDALGGSGAVYTFQRFGGFWLETDYLKAPGADPGEGFGYSVGLSGSLLAVSAPGDDLATGAVHVFAAAGSGWAPQATLRASNPDRADRFGETVAISGTTVVVGTPFEASAPGSGGSDDSLPQSGAAYVFALGGGGWVQQAFLKASNADFQDGFGGSVAVSGDIVVVGATNEDSDATGVNGDQGNSSPGSGSGAAYVFQRSGTRWSQTAYLKASNTGGNDLFGSAVAVSGDAVAIGAFSEDSYSKLIDGSQGDDLPLGRDSGAVYVFGGLFDR